MKFLRFLQNPQPRSLAWAVTTSSRRPRTTSTPPTSLRRPLATTTSRSTWRRWARPGPQLRRPDSAGQLLPLWTSTSTPPNRATLKNRATFFWSRTSWVSPELRLFRVKNPSAHSCKATQWEPCEFWGLIIWEVDIFCCKFATRVSSCTYKRWEKFWKKGKNSSVKVLQKKNSLLIFTKFNRLV